MTILLSLLFLSSDHSILKGVHFANFTLKQGQSYDIHSDNPYSVILLKHVQGKLNITYNLSSTPKGKPVQSGSLNLFGAKLFKDFLSLRFTNIRDKNPVHVDFVTASIDEECQHRTFVTNSATNNFDLIRLIKNREPDSKYCFIFAGAPSLNVHAHITLPPNDKLEIVGSSTDHGEIKNKSGQYNYKISNGYLLYTTGNETAKRKLQISYQNGTAPDKNLRKTGWIQGKDIISAETQIIFYVVVVGVVVLISAVIIVGYFAFWRKRDPAVGYSVVDGEGDRDRLHIDA